jgi:8-amino-7-oxononanoate synthase
MHTEAPGRTITQNGKTFLFFSGYSYLGMSHVPTFTDLLKEGIDRYGALFPSSRISNTTLSLYGHLEHYLSVLTGQRDTVTYASGFMACQALGHLLQAYGQVLVAPGTHPATGLTDTAWPPDATGLPDTAGRPGITDPGGAALAFTDWCARVREYACASPHDHFVLVTDSVMPLTGTIHDYVWLQGLPRHKRFTVVIDDSHGIGWMGEHGEGVSSALMRLPHVEYLLVYSLAKAFHVQGGAVSCPSSWADRLRRSPFYTASTAIAPAFAHTFLNAGTLYEVQRARLEHNMQAFAGMVRHMTSVRSTPTPVFPCPDPGIAGFLAENGILISSFAYPHPGSPPINRAVVSALHEMDDLERLAGLLAKSGSTL